MGRIPNDIVNIVRKMLVKETKKKCNNEYKSLFQTIDNLNCLLYDNNNFHYINFRDINMKGSYRKDIVCFLTDKKTKYKVPKNY